MSNSTTIFQLNIELKSGLIFSHVHKPNIEYEWFELSYYVSTKHNVVYNIKTTHGKESL